VPKCENYGKEIVGEHFVVTIQSNAQELKLNYYEKCYQELEEEENEYA